MKAHVTDLIKLIESGLTTGDMLRGIRAVEVLERIRSDDACALLTDLANGGVGVLLTEDAQRALERMKRK